MKAAASLVFSSLMAFDVARAQTQEPATEPPAETDQLLPHETTGIEASSADGRYSIHAWLRAQLRASFPFDDAPRTAEQFAEDDVADLALNRGRVKIGGH